MPQPQPPAAASTCSSDAPALQLNWKVDFGFVPDSIKFFTSVGAIAAGGFLVRHQLRPKTVSSLFKQLQSTFYMMEAPIIPVAVNPYHELTRRQAVIFTGRNKEGKTTRLASAIPWGRKSFVPIKGIYFNGAEGMSVSSFDMWVTTQMFGHAAHGGAEVADALKTHLSNQRIRGALTWMLGGRTPTILRPVPAVVIVDQLEELMMRYPVEAIGWVNQLTNAHVRDDKARVIFVVNSDFAVKTIQGLNQGDRWKVVSMSPADEPAVRGLLDELYFEGVQRNIGLYKEAKAHNVQQQDLVAFAKRTLDHWRKQFQVPYPLLSDRSWRDMPQGVLKGTLLRAFEAQLGAELLPDASPVYTDEEVHHSCDVVASAIKYLDDEVILGASEEKWQVLLAVKGGDTAWGLAQHLKRCLGNPAPVI